MKDQTKKRKERRVKFIPDFVADKIKTQLLCDERDFNAVGGEENRKLSFENGKKEEKEEEQQQNSPFLS